MTVFVIGTLHAGLTPCGELIEILEDLKVEKLLVEISQEDLRKGTISKYPPEMICAVNWARKNAVQTVGFDEPMGVLAENKTEEDNQRVIELQKKAMQDYNWKDMNNDNILDLLRIPEAEQLVNRKKEAEREERMLANIQPHLQENQRIAIVTGCSHLKMFETSLPEAVFPLRA